MTKGKTGLVDKPY